MHTREGGPKLVASMMMDGREARDEPVRAEDAPVELRDVPLYSIVLPQG